MKEGEVVAYKDSCRFIKNGCGLVVDLDCDDHNFVWIRWAGELQTNKVHISDLKVV